MPKEMLISKFKAQCIAELKRVHRTGQPLVVTLRGRPIARVEAVTEQEQSVIKLGRRRGQATLRGDLASADFSADWEMNR